METQHSFVKPNWMTFAPSFISAPTLVWCQVTLALVTLGAARAGGARMSVEMCQDVRCETQCVTCRRHETVTRDMATSSVNMLYVCTLNVNRKLKIISYLKEEDTVSPVDLTFTSRTRFL